MNRIRRIPGTQQVAGIHNIHMNIFKALFKLCNLFPSPDRHKAVILTVNPAIEVTFRFSVPD